MKMRVHTASVWKSSVERGKRSKSEASTAVVTTERPRRSVRAEVCVGAIPLEDGGQGRERLASAFVLIPYGDSRTLTDSRSGRSGDARRPATSLLPKTQTETGRMAAPFPFCFSHAGQAGFGAYSERPKPMPTDWSWPLK